MPANYQACRQKSLWFSTRRKKWC